ncbi:hypothetical protein, partial [Stenotrophomonas maltophilia]|uniref:hypothetical protein n=1 Tax=Stenotrophomonas maltophilia TaxID=40324 RepID=UPI0034E28485
FFIFGFLFFNFFETRFINKIGLWGFGFGGGGGGGGGGFFFFFVALGLAGGGWVVPVLDVI